MGLAHALELGHDPEGEADVAERIRRRDDRAERRERIRAQGAAGPGRRGNPDLRDDPRRPARDPRGSASARRVRDEGRRFAAVLDEIDQPRRRAEHGDRAGSFRSSATIPRVRRIAPAHQDACGSAAHARGGVRPTGWPGPAGPDAWAGLSRGPAGVRRSASPSRPRCMRGLSPGAVVSCLQAPAQAARVGAACRAR